MRKYLRKFLSIFMAFTITIGSVFIAPIKVQAAEQKPKGPYKFHWYDVQKFLKPKGGGYYNTSIKWVHFSPGLTGQKFAAAYCIDPDKKQAGSEGQMVSINEVRSLTNKIVSGKASGDLVAKCLKYGYAYYQPYKPSEAPKPVPGKVSPAVWAERRNFYVTQLAIWSFIQGWSDAEVDGLQPRNDWLAQQGLKNEDIPRLKRTIKEIRSKVKADNTENTPKLVLNSDKAKAGDLITLSGNKVSKSDIFNPSKYGYTREMTFESVGTWLDGTQLVKEDGTVLATASGGKIKYKGLLAGDKFKIVYPASAPPNTVMKYKIYGKPLVPVSYEFIISKNYQRLATSIITEFGVDTTGLVTNGDIPNKPTKDLNKIKIKKVDKDGAPLEGAKFECTGPGGPYNKVTDGNGYAEFDKLPDGKYEVRETEAPSGYETSDEVWNVTLPEDNKHEKTLQIVNERIYTIPYQITVKKQDPKGDRLEGVKFKCWSDEGYYCEGVTDRNGIIDFKDLSPDIYYIQEMETIPGYKPNPKVYKVQVPKQEGIQITYLNVVNERNVDDAQIKKVDADTKQPLAGAKFRITGPDGFDEELTSDENGIVPLKGLVAGDYTVQEIKAPTGYNLAKNPYYFTFTKEGPNQFEHVLENVPIKNKVKIKKIDEASLQPLKGAKFVITGPDGYSRTEVTNVLGEIDLGDVLYGEYTITEIESPEGYQMLIKPVKFKVEKDGEEQVIKIKNKKKIGELKLYKTDKDSGKPLQYAKYRIQGPNGFDEVIQTDKDGIIHMDFAEYGKYTVQEVEAPEGYVLDSTIHEVNVTEHKQVYEIRATNRVAQGDVIIDKVDDIGQSVPGATFELKRKDAEWVKTGVTDEKGHLEFNNVPWGMYQLRETDAPDGFVLDNSAKNFEINKDKQEFKYEYINRRIKGQLIITKIDKDTKEPLKGATFEIKKGNTLIQTVTTGNTGVAKIESLPYGEYTIIEKDAPPGYLLNTTPQKIFIRQDAEIYHVTFENKAGKGNIEITKYEDGSGRKLKGAEFTIWDKSMAQVDTVVTGDNGVGVSSSLPIGTYYVQETKAPIGYEIDPTMHPIVIGAEGRVIKYSLPNKQIKGKVKIKKIDSITKSPLKDVEFKIYEGDNVIDTLITDESGEATSKPLPFGNYILKETKTIDGYFTNTKTWDVVIDKHDKVITYEIENKPITIDVDINKTGELTGKAVPGAIFQLKKNGKVLTFKIGKESTTNLVTDKSGYIKVPEKLGVGNYELVEIKAPEGYLPAKPVKFEVNKESVNANPNGITINITDKEIKGNVKLVKVDEDTGKIMPNITFELFSKDGKSLGKYTTDENGVIEINDLDYGEYYLQETSKPHGYVEDTSKIYFKVQKDGQTITLNKTNKVIDGDLEVTKVDIETGDTLAGVVFKVINATTKESVGTYTTDSAGKFRINDLPFGKYYVKEIQGLDGYERDDTVDSFYIQEHGELITLTKYNKKIKGKIKITKTDVSDGKVIPNCGFRIYKDDKKTIVVEGKTDGLGVAEFELSYGKYYYQEFNAPEGYILDNRLFPFEIKQNGEIIKAHMTNEKIKGTMELTKVDISTGELVPNAKFRIYRDDKKTVVVKGVTDNNGIARFNLEYGKYYYQEYDAPNGYILDDTLFPFEIKINGDIVKCQMTNKPETGRMKLLKVDGKTGQPLQGATFGLYCGEKKVLEGVTNEQGVLEVAGLSKGIYTVKELKAPAGYQTLNQTYSINIKNKNDVEELKVCNWKYGVTIPKPGLPTIGSKPLVKTGVAATGGFSIIGILCGTAYIYMKNRR